MKEPKPAGFFTAAVSNVSSALVIPASPKRRSLTITAIGGNVFLSNKSDVTVTSGLKITDGQVATLLCSCHCGQFVCEQLFGIASAACVITVIEGFDEWPEQSNPIRS